MKLSSIVVEQKTQQPQASLIFFHGLGASGHDFLPVAQQLSALYPQMRCVLAHAPMQAVTANGGLRMRAWYDLRSWDLLANEDTIGMQNMARAVHQLIAEEVHVGIPSHCIMLAGFSQGGAMALYTGLRYEATLAAIIGLSCYLPDAQTTPLATADPTPLFLAHGRQDAVIPLSVAEAARKALETVGYAVDWHTYDMEHSVSEQELEDLSTFIGAILQSASLAGI